MCCEWACPGDYFVRLLRGNFNWRNFGIFVQFLKRFFLSFCLCLNFCMVKVVGFNLNHHKMLTENPTQLMLICCCSQNDGRLFTVQLFLSITGIIWKKFEKSDSSAFSQVVWMCVKHKVICFPPRFSFHFTHDKQSFNVDVKKELARLKEKDIKGRRKKITSWIFMDLQ